MYNLADVLTSLAGALTGFGVIRQEYPFEAAWGFVVRAAVILVVALIYSGYPP